MSKTVMLEYSYKKAEVTEEGFARIRQLIAEYQLCPSCKERIDQAEHLLVGKTCLSCVLTTHPSLTFVGLQRVDTDGDKHYAFTNLAGLTLTSEENSSDNPLEDVAFSIETAGFTIPKSYKPFKSDQYIELGNYGWKIYGKLSQSVIVIRHTESYSRSRSDVDFIAYKHGETVELNKRTTEHKNMLEKAKMLAERTKKDGKYHLPHIGYPITDLDETHLFPIIAQLESATYEAQLAFLAPVASEETQLEASSSEVPEPAQPDVIEQETLDITDAIEPEIPEEQSAENETTGEPGAEEQPEPAQEVAETILQPEGTDVPKHRGRLRVVKNEKDIPSEQAEQEEK